MSRLWPDRLLVSLAPAAVAAVRVTGRLRPRLADRQVRPCDPDHGAEPWQGALAALDSAIDPLRGTPLRVTVVLSNHFVRYAVVPHDAGARTPDDQLALAAFQFRKIHGERAGAWTVRVAAVRPGLPGLASAVDTALIEALRARFLRRGAARLASVQPWLMAAFNLWSGRPERDAWLLLVEAGRACCLRFESKYGMRTVQNVRGEFSAPDDWAELLERAALRAGANASAKAFVMCADRVAAPAATGTAWSFSALAPRAMSGFLPLEHAALSMALSAR